MNDSICWVDGRIQPLGEAAVPANDSAFAEGRGCYTSALIEAGRARFAERHVRRLERGARALHLGVVDVRRVMHAFRDLASAAFDGGDGIVRVQISRDPTGRARMVAIPRGIGDDPPTWTAITAAQAHEGPILTGGHKLTNRLVLALAADSLETAGVDEALLYDREGRLVEAARSNLVLVDAHGELVTPPADRGPVAGIAREVVSERVPELKERDVRSDDVLAAREILAINSVRGARPIVELDGGPVGRADGPGLARLQGALAYD